MDNTGLVTGIIVIVLLIVVAIVVGGAVRVVPQGFAGVVTRFGRFRREVAGGPHDHHPVHRQAASRRHARDAADRRPPGRDHARQRRRRGQRDHLQPGDRAPGSALYVSYYLVAIDQQARTTLRNAFGNVSLDEALSSREQINAAMQQQMEQVTDKWGIRINRIEIVDISPPVQILQAMALQKQADQEKRARILQSEGQQQSAVNIADGNRQAAIKQAEGERQAAILRAEGNRQAAILEAEGRAQAITTVYGSIKTAGPDPTLVAILQLDTLTNSRRAPTQSSWCRRKPPASSEPRRCCAVSWATRGPRTAGRRDRAAQQLSTSSPVAGQSSLSVTFPMNEAESRPRLVTRRWPPGCGHAPSTSSSASTGRSEWGRCFAVRSMPARSPR